MNWTLIGERIRYKRLQHNLTQEQLALFAQTSNIYICKIENGIANPTLPMLVKLCGALECSISYLIEGKNIVKYDSNAASVSKLLDHCSPYMIKVIKRIVKSLTDKDDSDDLTQ